MTDVRPEGVHMGHPLGDEMTLCGFAVDAFDEVMPTARAGEVITCKDCREVVRAIRAVRRWTLPK